MSKEDDVELERWRADWQEPRPRAAEVDVARLRRSVRFRTWTQLARVAVGIAGAVFALVILWRVAAVSTHWLDWGICGAFILLVSAFVGVELWWLRSLWRPADESTGAFVRLAVARARLWLRMCRLSVGLLVGEVVLFVPWIWLRHAERLEAGGTGALVYGFFLLAGLAGGGALILVWLKRRAVERLERLEALERSLSDPE